MKQLKQFYNEQIERQIESMTSEQFDEFISQLSEEQIDELFGIGAAVKRVGHAITRPFKVAKAAGQGVQDRTVLAGKEVKNKTVSAFGRMKDKIKGAVDKVKEKSRQMDVDQQKKLNLQQQKTAKLKKKAYEKTSGLKYTPPASKPKATRKAPASGVTPATPKQVRRKKTV